MMIEERIMKSNILKKAYLLAGICILASCAAKKDDNKNGGLTPVVGPQGHVSDLSSSDRGCDFKDGTITCSYKNPQTQSVCNITKTFNQQDIGNFCQQMNAIRTEAAQPNACDVQAVAAQVISQYCGNNGGMQPPNSNPNYPGNPGYPGGPGFPGNPGGPFPGGSSRFINCNVISNGSYPTYMSLLAGPGSHSFSEVSLNVPSRKLLKRIFGLPNKLGSVRVTYQPPQGTIPETLTATIKYRDQATDRDVLAKHSGYAGAPLVLDASINGAQITVSCNQGATTGSNRPVSDTANLVCVGSSHVLAGHGEEPIQWIKPINSFVAGEEARVADGVSVSLDKATSILTVHTNVDQLLGPNMTSSSSLRSDLLVEANEGIGRAKFTCSVK
jgi:hypothetical protein